VAQSLLLSNVIYVSSSYGSAEQTAFTVVLMAFLMFAVLLSFGQYLVRMVKQWFKPQANNMRKPASPLEIVSSPDK
jgi:Kef-type K+ transport system membrane component KefB